MSSSRPRIAPASSPVPVTSKGASSTSVTTPAERSSRRVATASRLRSSSSKRVLAATRRRAVLGESEQEDEPVHRFLIAPVHVVKNEQDRASQRRAQRGQDLRRTDVAARYRPWDFTSRGSVRSCRGPGSPRNNVGDQASNLLSPQGIQSLDCSAGTLGSVPSRPPGRTPAARTG